MRVHSNLDTACDPPTHIDYWKQQIQISTSNLFKVAENTIETNPDLKKVIILNRVPRYDKESVDPHGMKSKLSLYGNSLYQQLWMEAGCPDKIVIGEHALDCFGELRDKRFGHPDSRDFDGIHMRGPAGMFHYTNGVIRIFKTVFPQLQTTHPTPYRPAPPPQTSVSPSPTVTRPSRPVLLPTPPSGTARPRVGQVNYSRPRHSVNPWIDGVPPRQWRPRFTPPPHSSNRVPLGPQHRVQQTQHYQRPSVHHGEWNVAGRSSVHPGNMWQDQYSVPTYNRWSVLGN